MKKPLFFLLILLLAAPLCGYGQTAEQLEAEALRAYERGYAEKDPAAQAQAFEEAARRFERAAQAYRQAGQAEKARSMTGFATSARDNAEHRRRLVQDEAFAQIGTLTGAAFKPMPANGQPSHERPPSNHTPAAPFRPRLGIGIGVAIGTGPAPLIIPGPTAVDAFVQAVYEDPEQFERLLELLMGEFFPGSLTGEMPEAIHLTGSTQLMPALSLMLALSPSLEVKLSGHYFRSNWSGKLSAAVIPFEGDPYIEPVLMEAAADGLLADLSLRYYLSRRSLRPYAELGARAQLPISSSSGMVFAGQDLPLHLETVAKDFAPFAGAGLRVRIGRSVFAEAGATFARWPGQPDYGLGGGAQLGVWF